MSTEEEKKTGNPEATYPPPFSSDRKGVQQHEQKIKVHRLDIHKGKWWGGKYE